ncbi:MAG: AMIN domain-containing protein, partial [Deltaproteobacteria bacterium]|nr:AMIN domain-containing protein [Deltaproteobacteria bacterium]
MSFLRARNRQFFLKLPTLALVCLGAGLAPGMFGCAVGIEEERVTQVPTVSEVQSKSTVEEKVPQPLATIKETTLEEQPFKLQELSVREEHGQTTIRLQFSNPASQYRHFSLTQPSRIVLDIFGETKRLARVEIFRVDTNWVGALRLSSSEGYLRLVMEIAAATLPAYVIEPEDGGLKVIIGPLDPKATAKKELQLIQGEKRTDINIKVAEAKPAVPETAPTASVAPETAPTAPIPETPPTAEKEYTGQRISLDFKDADIKNVILAGADQVAVDAVAAKIMGFDPMSIKFIRLGHEHGLGSGDIREIEVVGEDISEVNWRFEGTGNTFASRGQKLIYWGPLKPLENLLLRSPIAPWAFVPSNLYHNAY